MTRPDPRPPVEVSGDVVTLVASSCDSCGYVAVGVVPACPVCGAAVSRAGCGPRGSVWASTVVRIPVPDREPPYGLAYVDIEDGPRILAHTPGDAAMPVGSSVELGPLSAAGDLTVVPA
jgi:uncharacterized OB-fold protein